MPWRSTLRSMTPRRIRKLGRGTETSSCVPLGTSRNSYAPTTPTTTKNLLTRAVHTTPRIHQSNTRNQRSQTNNLVKDPVRTLVGFDLRLARIFAVAGELEGARGLQFVLTYS